MRALMVIAALTLSPLLNDEDQGSVALVVEPEMEIARGEGRLPLQIEVAEKLVYLVEVDVGPFKGVSVGEAVFKSEQEGSGEVEAGAFEAAFKASHLGYKLDHRLISRHASGEEPVLESSDTQRGSESRRRRLRIGERGGVWTSEYRYDGHCTGCDNKDHFVHPRLPWNKHAHCKKCKSGDHRVWREMKSRAVPAHTLDFLSVIYLIRSLVGSEVLRVEEPLIEKNRLWTVSMEISGGRAVVVPLGEFECSRVLLDATKPESEPDGGEFGGLFGMQGTLKLWVHTATGVLVQIEGEIPVGPMDLGVKIRLKEAEGTPKGFGVIAR